MTDILTFSKPIWVRVISACLTVAPVKMELHGSENRNSGMNVHS